MNLDDYRLGGRLYIDNRLSWRKMWRGSLSDAILNWLVWFKL